MFALDVRGLAAFRIGLGLIILCDVINRSTALRAHYTDFGVLPRDEMSGVVFEHSISVFLMGSSLWVQSALMFLMGILALLFLVGYRTKLVGLVLWVFLLSLQNRNYLVLQAGDILLRLLMFWALFLPIANRWSVDAALGRVRSVSRTVTSTATAGVILQIFSIYFFTAVLKSGKEWWPDLSASMIALQLDQFATPFGIWFRQFDSLIEGATAAVYGLEWVGPFLLLLPLWGGWIRGFTAVAFIAMHLGFASMMALGLFPFVDVVGLLAFLPSKFWDRLGNWFAPSPSLRVFYDGECGVCRKMAALLAEFGLVQPNLVAPASDDPRAHSAMQTHQSWVIADQDRGFRFGFDGFLALCGGSRLYRPLRWLLDHRLGRWFGERAYRLLADRRQLLSRLTPSTPPRPDLLLSRPALLFCGGLVGLCFWWNLATVQRWEITFPKVFKPLMWSLRLDQRWNMFAPRPLKESGWMVFDGKLVNGKSVDPFRRMARDVTFKKPAVVSRTYKNQRWRKYLMNLSKNRFKAQRLHFGRFLCRRWNRPQDSRREKLSHFSIYYMRQRIEVDRKTEAKRRLLWRHNCFG